MKRSLSQQANVRCLLYSAMQRSPSARHRLEEVSSGVTDKKKKGVRLRLAKRSGQMGVI